MPYGRNPVNFLSAEISDDEGMGSMLHCHMQCLEFLPIPVIEICANTSAAMQPFEVIRSVAPVRLLWSAGGGEVWNETSNLKKGFAFPDKKSLGEAMKIFSFKRHVNYVTRSGGKNYEAMCVKHNNGCPWRVRACLKANIGMWLITKYDSDHCCATPSVSQDHSKLDSDIISGLIRGMVQRSADVPISQIIQRVKDEYQFTVSYRKAWLGKQKALAMVYGKWEAPYDTLRRWMRAVQDHLPRTIISFQHRPIPDNDSDVQFHRLF
ncbi:uncharacterized protein G2W53_018686 [Senna tora]|uniref:Transposase MuDR plant domain-containing protein n=1 Tax=Senna tora TaxID=362788 RepID=A0A834TSV2_9FABA|nr:uncharacterized protein G2W53_018686 [Senna tora]